MDTKKAILLVALAVGTMVLVEASEKEDAQRNVAEAASPAQTIDTAPLGATESARVASADGVVR